MSDTTHTSSANNDAMDDPCQFEYSAFEPADRISDAQKLLPAWFVPRMMGDNWYFAFIMVNGDIVYFCHINRVHQSADGGLWLDLSLRLRLDVDLSVSTVYGEDRGRSSIGAPTSRTTASINVQHIMMAFETADTPQRDHLSL